MTSSDRPPAPRWQFRLRTALVAITLVSVALAWWTYEVQALRRRRLAVDRITAWQQQLTSKPDHWIFSPLNVQAEPVPWWLAISGEAQRQKVTTLSFDVRSYDDGLEEPSTIDDDAVRVIATLTELRRLELPRSKVTDAGLATLTSLPNLTSLDLSGTAVTDEGLRHVGQLRNLRVLVLNGVQITGAGLAHLAQCPLRELSLRDAPLESAHTQHLNAFTSLEGLTIFSPTLDQLHLQDLPKLSHVLLGLSGREIDLQLEQLPALDQVVVHSDARSAVRKLKLAHLPQLSQLHLSVGGLSPPASSVDSLVLDDLPALRTVNMPQGGIAARIAPQLAALENLHELSLGDVGPIFDDEALRNFAGHQSLTKLTLGNSGVTDDGLTTIATLPNLESLSLRSERITAAGIAALAAAPRLKTLSLSGVHGEADPGVALAKLRWLEDATLADCRCPSITVASATDFARLKTLHLKGPDVEAVCVTGLRALENLDLQLPQAHSFEIRDLPQLARLDVSFATGQVVEQFVMADLPELSWLSLQCGPTGAKMPADMFDHLLTFPKLRSGIIWGLELPDEAKSQLVRYAEATGRKLD